MEGIQKKDFTCERDGLTIRGYEVCAAGAAASGERLPALICSHGFSGIGDHLLWYCEAFAGQGYVTFVYDFCGGSVIGRSDGEVPDMTIASECADLQAVIDYVKKLPCVDPERIMLLGESQGGFVTALTAARTFPEAERIALIFPALCIPDHARAGALAGSSYDVENVPEIIDCGAMKLGRAFHEGVVAMDPFAEIAGYGGPVLILHGTADDVVNYTYSQRAEEAYGSRCHLELIRDAGHGFSEGQRAGVLASIRQFALGKKEILTVSVRITGSRATGEGEILYQDVFFDGSCDTPYFQGNILEGAVDHQQYRGDECLGLRAEYTLEGRDSEGSLCRIEIVNTSKGGEWKPEIRTDSKALRFLEEADLTAALEFYEGGLTVRIFA